MGAAAERRERVQWLFSRVGLRPEAAKKFPHEFSGRPAPAPGHCARAGAEPQAHRVRRAGVRARRVGAGAGGQPADGPAGRVRHRLPVRGARPGGGAPHQPPRGRDVPRAHRGDRRPRHAVLQAPLHPYTEILLSAVPVPNPRTPARRMLLQGDPPSPANPPSGCRFHTRCPMAQAVCKEQVPELSERPSSSRRRALGGLSLSLNDLLLLCAVQSHSGRDVR
jgi:peptide/nickel transport system ATP-binding protein